MPKKIKLNLKDLNVKSFTTSDDKLKGGLAFTDDHACLMLTENWNCSVGCDDQTGMKCVNHTEQHC